MKNFIVSGPILLEVGRAMGHRHVDFIGLGLKNPNAACGGPDMLWLEDVFFFLVNFDY